MSATRLSQTHIDSVSKKYAIAGWTLITPPKGTLNDLIAQHPNGRMIHMIQITYPDDSRILGIPNSTFVQNAFSNGATPVRASIIAKAQKKTQNKVGKGEKASEYKISLIDANTNNKIIIRTHKEKKLEANKN